MVRPAKKVETVNDDDRSKLKKLAFSRNLLSQNPSKPQSILSPTKTVIKHDGRDIVKKSQRKNRYLFSFPGLLAPLSGGKIGELKDLGTKNPILYLDFPQGQVKLFGTIVYPKNRYLTLQFSKGGKNVVCEDNFDNMGVPWCNGKVAIIVTLRSQVRLPETTSLLAGIVFSDAWWIGQKDENPEEVQLEFPKHLTEGKHTDVDFKGGAGSTMEQKQVPSKPGKEQDKPKSPESPLEDDLSEDSSSSAKNKDMMEVTPVRHSARTAGKTFKFADSSGDDSVESGSDTSQLMEKRVRKKLDVTMGSSIGKTDDSSDAIDGVDVVENQNPSFPVKSTEIYVRKRGSLVQATLSSLFEKVEERKSTGSARKLSSPKGTPKKLAGSRRKTNQVKDEGPGKKGVLVKERKPGIESNKKKKQIEVEDDDIEVLSSQSEDIDESDEDWAA